MKKSARIRLIEERRRRQWSQQKVADLLGTTQHNVSRWERGQTIPGSYFRARLCELFGKSAQELDLPGGPLAEGEQGRTSPLSMFDASGTPLSSIEQNAPFWHVPYPRNPFFTGRDAILQLLDIRLRRANASSPLTRSYALHGLGGVGKTQIALEYVYRYAAAYSAILWISAESYESLFASFVSIAEVLQLPERQEQDQHRVVRAITQWLIKQKAWLLVFDNVEDLGLLQPFLPSTHQGSLLLTTRLQALGTIAQQIRVEPLNPEESLAFLLRRAKLLTPGLSPTRLSACDMRAAQAIVHELNGLPLALDQAGAYIEEAQCNLENYLHQYQQRRSRLLERRGSSGQDHPASVQAILILSFQKVRQRNPFAADVLQLCAYLASDAIPEEVLAVEFSSDGEPLRMLVADPWLLDEVIAVLSTYSLVHRDPAARTLSLHRLVQAVLQDTLEERERYAWAERAMRVINAAFPTVEHSTWPQCERLLPQALVAAQIIEQYRIVSEEAGRLLYEAATYLRERARYEEAEPLYQRALQIREQCLGPEHPLVAYVVNGLAILYYDQGRYELAEPLYQRAQQIREQHLGPEHPDVTYALNGLALLYYNQNKYEQAEPLYQRALQIREQYLGSEHPLVAHPLNNLAILYYDQGKYEQAEPLYQRALWLLEQSLGPKHPDIAAPLNGLARLYYDQGKYEQAEPLYRRALQIREQHLGPEHFRVTYSLTGLASLYQEQGKYEQAALLYQRALWILEQHLGPEHPLVPYPLDGLASLYAEQSKYEQAEPLYQRGLQIREQHLELQHSDMAYSFNGLANLYRDQRKDTQAEMLYQRALRIREQALRLEHPLSAKTMHDFARFRDMQGNHEEARAMYTHALMVREQALGAYHPHTIETRRSLIALLRTIELHEEATRLDAPPLERSYP